MSYVHFSSTLVKIKCLENTSAQALQFVSKIEKLLVFLWVGGIVETVSNQDGKICFFAAGIYDIYLPCFMLLSFYFTEILIFLAN